MKQLYIYNSNYLYIYSIYIYIRCIWLDTCDLFRGRLFFVFALRVMRCFELRKGNV